MKGKVYLVGAGPGDPGLLTLKGRECLQKADVVFYDALANPVLLGHALKAKKIFVGKRGGTLSGNQTRLHKQMIAQAQKGLTVVRLKGGDPFIFGRGGEEIAALSQAKIAFEIVPGITAANGVAAYAGIPLTHRDHTSEVAFVTGHQTDQTNWQALAAMRTLVFFMGTARLEANMKALIKAGKKASTPAVLISWGTYAQQQMIKGSVTSLAGKVKKQKVTAPNLVIVGEVVKLAPQLAWFTPPPLAGQKVLLTRAFHQVAKMRTLLEAKGAQVFCLPTIEIKPPTSFRALDKSIKIIAQYDIIIFTSVHAVSGFLKRLSYLKKDIRDLSHLKMAAIGETTQAFMLDKGLWVDILPSKYRAEGLMAAFKAKDIKGKKILLPRAAKARDVLATHLQKQADQVDVVPVYQTKTAKVSRTDIDFIVKQAPFDWISFTSGSTVEGFVKLLSSAQLKKVCHRSKIACIGPITAKTVKKQGLRVTKIASKASVSALIAAIR